jgi:two-component system, sensor histidine kinase and response regulator
MLPPLQILLVEDNPINQKVAARLLEKAGHAVTVAENGRVALDIVTARQFDLVLMDISMPEMDGLETTAAIRQREAGTDRHLPIVALTAHAMVGDRERCLGAGMDGYVTKPVIQALLFQAMADALGLRRGA